MNKINPRVWRIIAVLLVAALAYVFAPQAEQRSKGELEAAIEARASDVQVQGEGVIIKVLPDDEHGSRHQRLIIRLTSGNTLLIAHNIDLAPRVPEPKQGDTLEFYGEYVWNDKGGVIHWTHHDPAGRHPGGWLRHKGVKYD